MPSCHYLGSYQSENTLINLFGTYNGETRIDRGWLTKETVIQLKILGNPTKMWKKSLQGKVVSTVSFQLFISTRN